MLFLHAHGFRYRSIAIAVLLVLLQVSRTWEPSAFVVKLTDRLHARDIDTKDPSASTLPYSVYIDSPAKKYQNSVVKGCKLWSLLQREDDAPGSQWTGADDMANWGWESTAPAGDLDSESTDVRLAQLLGNIKGPLAEKGVDITGADGMFNIETTHTAPDKPPNYGANQEYKPTNAMFYEAYNTKSGVIVAYNNYGPAYESERDPQWDDAPLPGMSTWSDVVGAVWTKITSPTGRRLLRYVVRMNVINEDTTDVVSVALKKVGQLNGIPPPWPGLVFAPPAATKLKEDIAMQQAFQAVLATPNVRGVVWLLLQHKWQLGAKTVKSITVWDMSGLATQSSGSQLAILVEIADYAPN